MGGQYVTMRLELELLGGLEMFLVPAVGFFGLKLSFFLPLSFFSVYYPAVLLF